MSDSTHHDEPGDSNTQQGGTVGQTARRYLAHFKRNWVGGGKDKAIVAAKMFACAVGRTARAYLGHLRRSWTSGRKGKAIVVAELFAVCLVLRAVGFGGTPQTSEANSSDYLSPRLPQAESAGGPTIPPPLDTNTATTTYTYIPYDSLLQAPPKAGTLIETRARVDSTIFNNSGTLLFVTFPFDGGTKRIIQAKIVKRSLGDNSDTPLYGKWQSLACGVGDLLYVRGALSQPKTLHDDDSGLSFDAYTITAEDLSVFGWIGAQDSVDRYFPLNRKIHYLVRLKSRNPFGMIAKVRWYERVDGWVREQQRWKQAKLHLENSCVLQFFDRALWHTQCYDLPNEKTSYGQPLYEELFAGPERASDRVRNIHFDFARAKHEASLHIGGVTYEDCWVWHIGDETLTVAAGYGIVREETSEYLLVRDPNGRGGLTNPGATAYKVVDYDVLAENLNAYRGQDVETHAIVEAIWDFPSHVQVHLSGPNGTHAFRISLYISKRHATGTKTNPSYVRFMSHGFRKGDAIGIRGIPMFVQAEPVLLSQELRKGRSAWKRQ